MASTVPSPPSNSGKWVLTSGVVEVINGTLTIQGNQQWTYVGPTSASIGTVTPSSGPITGGTTVTISGAGFTGTNTVLVGTTSVPFKFVNDKTVTIVTKPASAGVADIRVLTTNDGNTPITSADQFTFISAAPTGTAGNIKTFLLDFDSTEYDWATVAPTYAVIVLNSWNASWIPAIKRASPTTKCFVYKDLSSVRDNSCTGGTGDSCIADGVLAPAGIEDSAQLPTGVGFCYTVRNHPEWLLKTAAGAYVTETGYPAQYMTDFGNPTYQAAWLAGVIADVKAGGWDGVFMDNALNNTNYGTPANYTTPAAFQAGTLSMLKVVGPGLTAAGIENFANVGYNNLFPTLWAQWLPYCTGLFDEFFMYWGDNSYNGTGSYWTTLMEQVQVAVSTGKTCLFNVGGGTLTTAQIEMAAASLLLYADGNQLVSYGDSSDDTQDSTWLLGAALGSATVSNGVYTRQFANGSVRVNPAAGTGTITVTPVQSELLGREFLGAL